jgi:sulfur carrier protein ThiS
MERKQRTNEQRRAALMETSEVWYWICPVEKRESRMKVRVKLFGTLSQGFPGYRHSQGMEIEIPEGAMVKDLLALLEISESQGAVVIAEGRILKADDKMPHGVPVSVLQAIGGG